MRTVTSCDGTPIAYWHEGRGPVLVLVGGALRGLSSRFTVYGFDRRGHGASGDTVPYALAREVEDVEAVITAAGGRAFVVGLPGAGHVALEAARRLPSVSRVAILDPATTGSLPIPSLFAASPADLITFFLRPTARRTPAPPR